MKLRQTLLVKGRECCMSVSLFLLTCNILHETSIVKVKACFTLHSQHVHGNALSGSLPSLAEGTM